MNTSNDIYIHLVPQLKTNLSTISSHTTSPNNRIFINNIISTAHLEDNLALKNMLERLNFVCEKTELEIYITLDSADADFIDEKECSYQMV